MSIPDPLSFLPKATELGGMRAPGSEVAMRLSSFVILATLLTCVLYQSCPTDIIPFNVLLNLLSGTAKDLQTLSLSETLTMFLPSGMGQYWLRKRHLEVFFVFTLFHPSVI